MPASPIASAAAEISTMERSCLLQALPSLKKKLRTSAATTCVTPLGLVFHVLCTYTTDCSSDCADKLSKPCFSSPAVKRRKHFLPHLSASHSNGIESL